MKQALCLQHVPFEGPGVFERILKRQRFNLTRRLVPTEGLPPDAGDFLLVMGGPMSANDPDPWIQQELRFHSGGGRRRRAVPRRLPRKPDAREGHGRTRVQRAGRRNRHDRDALTREGRHDRLIGFLPGRRRCRRMARGGNRASAGRNHRSPRRGFSRPGLPLRQRTPSACSSIIELDRKGLEALCRHCPEDLARAGLTAESVQRPRSPTCAPLHELASQLWTAGERATCWTRDELVEACIAGRAEAQPAVFAPTGKPDRDVVDCMAGGRRPVFYDTRRLLMDTGRVPYVPAS